MSFTLPDIEAVVLGSALLQTDVAEVLVDRLTPEHFTLETSQFIFKAIRDCLLAKQPTDPITVTRRLARTAHWEETGTMAELMSLMAQVSSLSLAPYYADQLEDDLQLRQLDFIGRRLSMQSHQPDAHAAPLVESLQQELGALLNPIDHPSEPIGIIADRVWDMLQATDNPLALSSGWEAYDKLSDGFPPEELIIVAGRPGMGKTLLALHWAWEVAQSGHPAALFSLEMSSEQLTMRLLSQISQVPLTHLRQRTLNSNYQYSLQKAMEQLHDAPLFLDDTAALSVPQFRAKARALQSQKKIEWLGLDYLQLLTPDKANNREQAIAQLSRDLKALARTMHIPLIVLSQLSRSVESRNDKRPMLSDLRESGAIEQDADQVLFVFRPSYYDHSDDRTIELILAKHRNGPTGVTHCVWDPSTGMIYGPNVKM